MKKTMVKMIKEAEDVAKEHCTTIDGEVSIMKENIMLLKSIDGNTMEGPEKYQKIINKLETIKGIKVKLLM